MAEDGTPTLEVGFAIEPNYAELEQLQRIMDSTEAKVVADAAKIEQATGGMLNLGGATAQLSAFGGAATREMANAQAAANRAEKAGEALSRQMDRQITTFGMSRAAAAALAAEQNGLAELAGRLRTQEATLTSMREKSAAAMRAEAVAVRGLASSSAASMTTGGHAAAGFSAGMAGLGASTQATKIAMLDLTHVGINMSQMLATGTNPMRALMMESGRLATALQYSGNGVTGLIKLLAQMTGIIKTVQDAQLAEAAATTGAQAMAIASIAERERASIAAAEIEIELALAAERVAKTEAGAAVASARLTAAYEAQEVAAMQLTVAEDALAVAQGRAAEAAAASTAATRTVIGGSGVGLLGIAVVAGVAYGAIRQFQDQVKGSGELDKFAEGLRLTDEQIKKAGGSVKYLADGTREITGLTVTFGDVMAGVFAEISKEANSGSAWDKFKGNASSAFSGVLDVWDKTSAALSAGMWTLGGIAKDVFQYIGQKIGQGFYDGVNKAIDAINSLNAKIPAWAGGGDPNLISHLKPDKAVADLAGLGATIRKQADKNYADALAANKSAYAGIEKAAIEHSKKMLQIESDANKPKKPKHQSDHGLADALKELDAAIKGQLALAAAYQVSDVAAMRAEALQKAEEQAIRHKGDVGVFYEKELALAIATRAAEGGKVIADLHAETAARTVINDLVAQGIIPVQQLSQELEKQSKKRALEAALEAAEDEHRLDLVQQLRAELGNLRNAQDDANQQAAHSVALQDIGAKQDQLDQLRLEASLIGATNQERAVAVAQLQAEQRIKALGLKDTPDDPTVVERYLATQKAVAVQTEQNTAAIDAHNASLSYMADLLSLIDERAQTMASTLGNAFGNLGNSLGQAISSLTNYAATQAKLDADHQKAVEAGVSTEKEQALYAQASGNAQAKAIGGVIDATKNLFAQHSAAYKAMDAVEKAYAAAQLARTIASIAPNIAAGAAKMFSALGPFGFAAVAAMVAVMAGFGFSGGTSSAVAPTSPEDLQKSAGAGTVLGDPAAKSASIASSLDLMSKTDVKLLDNSAGMLNELRSISSNIGNLAAAIARNLNPSGGFFDTQGKTGTNSSGGFLGLFGSTTTKSLYDQGYQFDPATIQQIIQQGVTGATYQVIESVKHKSGFLGIGSSTKTSYDTTTGPLDSEISGQIQGVVNQLYKTVVDAAKVLGLDVGDALQQFQVEIGQISFKDLTGQQITDQLNAIFSKLGDQMAGFAVAGLQQFQQAGEGLYQTLMRLAKDYLTVDAALKSIDMTFGSVGASSIAARESLINLAGGLDSFVSQVNFFYDHFLSDSQKVAMEQQQVTAAFQSLGVAQPKTIAGFTQLVQGLDLSTDAGQQMFEALMQIAPAFYDVATAADQLAQKQQELQVQLLQAQGNTAGATALERQVQLAALDPSLQALQQQVWAAQDAAAATAAATELQNKKSQMQIQLLQAQGNATAALALQRQQELAQLDPTLRALQKQIYLAQDVATARDNLTQAYQRESQALQQTIDKFRGFAATLKQFRDSLFTGDSSTLGYNQSLVQLMKESGLANAGDEGALGGGLQDAAGKFLDIATQNAGSLQDVQRARALVARYIDQAAATANSRADVSQQQLDTMHNQVAKLVDIDDHVLSVAAAIKQLNALLAPPPPVANSSGGTGRSRGSGASQNAHLDKILDKLHEIHTATETGATAANTTARTLKQSVREGAMVVRTDSDTPIAVTGDTVSLA